MEVVLRKQARIISRNVIYLKKKCYVRPSLVIKPYLCWDLIEFCSLGGTRTKFGYQSQNKRMGNPRWPMLTVGEFIFLETRQDWVKLVWSGQKLVEKLKTNSLTKNCCEAIRYFLQLSHFVAIIVVKKPEKNSVTSSFEWPLIEIYYWKRRTLN